MNFLLGQFRLSRTDHYFDEMALSHQHWLAFGHLSETKQAPLRSFF